ncbi:SAUR-like auxin-responsive protein family [Actinidia rufa]|uniref:SAUR-like auxin-responsive protein family n=1 Tax=Actinidia rufa TaxID=165716 RepID=A0A7J0DL06_9ERIC|nr:SAUR-like auxin-responsive protein family [Actinidia rufa]
MEDNEGNKVTGIWQIVRLKELIHKWQSTTLGPKVNNLLSERTQGGISPAISKRLRSFNSCCDSDEDGCQSPEPPHDVPKGYLAVYVGPELRSGGLKIPCEIETFKYLLKVMETHQSNQPKDDTAGTSFAMEE